MRRLALLLSVLPVVALAAPPTVIYRRSTDVRPALVAGDLAGPTSLAPEAAARAFLRATALAPVDPALLGEARVLRLTSGPLVRFALRHAGLPIVDASVAVRLDPAGAVRLMSGTPLRLDGAASATPLIDAAEAKSLVAAYAPARAGLAAQAAARLVWMPAPDRRLQLAWEVRLPAVPALAEALLFRIDARSGALIAARNLVRFADQAQVYEANPVKTPNLTTVTLDDRDQGSDALLNPFLDVRNCIDNHNTTTISIMGQTMTVHVCDEISTVTRDGNGDYLQYQPVLEAPATNPDAAEDPFAELQMYYHVWKIYRYYQAFDPAFELLAKPIRATVNFRMPMDMITGAGDPTNPNGPLYPFDNAMFMPPGALGGFLERPASIIFGQGTQDDFAYDGDVVYHEFTHAMIWSTSDIGASGPELDEMGLDPAPLALNEGFADVFAGFVSDDGQIGDYAGQALTGGAIRDLEESYACPDLLWGESHQDSMAMSGAVWSVRQALGAAAEEPVFAAVTGLPTDADFTVAATAIEQELETAIDAAAAQTAHDTFLAHGLIDCRRVIPYTGPRQYLFTEGTSIGISPVPGYLQFRYTLPEAASALSVSFGWQSSSMGFGTGTPSYQVYVRAGQEIAWSYDTMPVAEKDYEFPLTASGSNAYAGELTANLPAGDYYLQIVNTGQAGGIAMAVTIGYTAAPPQEDAGPPPQEDAGAPQNDAGSGATGDGGCGCRAASRAGAPLLAALLGLALCARRRRRD